MGISSDQLSGALERLLRGYCRWQSPDELIGSFMESCCCSTENLQELCIQYSSSHEVCQNFPPPLQYRRKFLRALMQFFESRGAEVDDCVMGALSEVLCQQEQDRGWGYKTFFYRIYSGPSFHSISLRLSSNILDGSTGCYQWEAGFLLSQYILSNPELVEGRCCLELGAGSGLLGIILHRMGAAHVILTDGNDVTLRNCRHNVDLNLSTDNKRAAEVEDVSVLPLQWGDPLPAQLRVPSLVLGADLFYDPRSFKQLTTTLIDIVQLSKPPESCPIYLAACRRSEATLHAFFDQAKRTGLRVEDVTAEVNASRAKLFDVLPDSLTDFLLLRLTLQRPLRLEGLKQQA